MRRWSIVLTLGILAGAIARAEEPPRLPPLPKLVVADFPSEVRTQVAEADRAARANPHSAGASGRLAMLLELYDRPAEAVACYERAHQLDPASFRWLYYLGALLAKQGRRAAAVQTLRAALAKRPDYLPARLKLADALFAAGDLDQSRAEYAGIIKSALGVAEAYYGLGRIDAARGNLADAAKSFREACDLFPPYGAAHYALAQVERKLGQSEDVDRQLALYAKNRTLVPPVADPLRDALRRLDRRAASLLERGVQLQQAGRLDDAIAATERALELDPKLVQAHVNLVNLYGRTGNVAKAEEHYRAVVELDPSQFPDAYYNYGVLMVKAGRLPEAEEAFRGALAINPHYAEAANDLGYLLEREGKLAEAAGQYRQAIADQPSFRQAHFNLGRILVNQGDYEEGIRQLRETLTSADENTPAYLYALGAAYGRAGNRAAARRFMQEARSQASALGQASLVSAIDQDLRRLDQR